MVQITANSDQSLNERIRRKEKRNTSIPAKINSASDICGYALSISRKTKKVDNKATQLQKGHGFNLVYLLGFNSLDLSPKKKIVNDVRTNPQVGNTPAEQNPPRPVTNSKAFS